MQGADLLTRSNQEQLGESNQRSSIYWTTGPAALPLPGQQNLMYRTRLRHQVKILIFRILHHDYISAKTNDSPISLKCLSSASKQMQVCQRHCTVTWTQVDSSHCVDDMTCLFFLYQLDAAGKTEGSWWKRSDSTSLKATLCRNSYFVQFCTFNFSNPRFL